MKTKIVNSTKPEKKHKRKKNVSDTIFNLVSGTRASEEYPTSEL